MQETDTSRRELPMKALNYWVFLILGLMVIGLGVFGMYELTGSAQKNSLGLPILLLPLGGGLYLMALAMRSRVVIDGSRIDVRTPFSEKSADASEVDGYREVSTRNSSFWRLQLKDERGTITIQKWFDSPEMRAWLGQITNFDERDRKAILDEIEQNADLGATPEERLGALKQASLWNICITTIAIAAALCLLFKGNPFLLTAAVVLALTPPAILYFLYKSPLLFALGKPKRDPRADFTIAFIASGFGLFFGARGDNFVSLQSLLPQIVLISLALAAGLLLAARKNMGRRGMWVSIIVLSGSYGYGLITSTDTMLDQSTAESYSASIVGKHTVSGKSTTHYLDLAPWGPMTDENKLSVSRALYNAAAVGDTACVELHQGYLHAPWYRQVECIQP